MCINHMVQTFTTPKQPVALHGAQKLMMTKASVKATQWVSVIFWEINCVFSYQRPPDRSVGSVRQKFAHQKDVLKFWQRDTKSSECADIYSEIIQFKSTDDVVRSTILSVIDANTMSTDYKFPVESLKGPFALGFEDGSPSNQSWEKSQRRFHKNGEDVPRSLDLREPGVATRSLRSEMYIRVRKCLLQIRLVRWCTLGTTKDN